MPLKTHVAAPGSTKSERLTTKPAREGFASMCACTEPVRTGVGVVCVEYGRLEWPITMLNYTHGEKKKHLHYTPLMTRYEEAFFSLENQEKKGSRFALRAPHY